MQLQQLGEQLDAKDKEVRAQTLAAKQAQRSLEETRSAAAKTAADVNARVAEAVAAAEARQKLATDAGLHLMLCIIRDPGSQQVKQRVLAVPESKVGSSGCQVSKYQILKHGYLCEPQQCCQHYGHPAADLAAAVRASTVGQLLLFDKVSMGT